jgi:hypothetical protein
MNRHLLACAPLWLVVPGPCLAQQPAPDPAPPPRHEAGGDLDKIAWERPFARAQQLAREQDRVLLVKPILGGSNTPRPTGVACGGVDDCEGSW